MILCEALMPQKSIFFKKMPAPHSTYKTQHKFDQRKHLSLDKKRRESCDPFIFVPEGRHFNKLSPSQKLIFIFAVSTLMSTAVAAPPSRKSSGVKTDAMQQAVVPSNQNAFFPQPQRQFTSLVPSPLASHSYQVTAQPSYQLKRPDMSNRLQVHVVTTLLSDCQKKSNGVSAGKVCLIKDKKHLLKACGNELGITDKYSNTLLGMHNLFFIKENMGVNIPNVRLVYEKNGQYISSDGQAVKAENYLASEFVEGFTSFKDISSRHTRMMRKSHHLRKVDLNDAIIQAGIREKIVGQMGEVGLAKLAVAGTFIQDLVMNDGNWGVANNKLVIIDADHSPQSLEEYLMEAAKMPVNINLDFSIQTLEHMISTYNQMLHKMPIAFHPKVDFTLENYRFLMGQYLIACNKTLDQIKTTQPGLPRDKPSKEINQALSDALRKQLLEYTKAGSDASSFAIKIVGS